MKEIEGIFEKIKREPLFFSIIQLAELADWCTKENRDVKDRVRWLKKIAYMTNLNEDICIQGSEIKHKRRKDGIKDFSLIDGLILASARAVNQKLLTADSHFEDAKDVILI